MNDAQSLFSFIVSWVFLVLCIFGLVSNLVSVVIYSHPLMRSPINILLAGLSSIDLCLCLLAVGAFCIPGLQIVYERELSALVAYAAAYVYPWTMIAQSCSIFTFVVISFERFIAVCWPFRARWCTIGRSLRALTIVGVLGCLYNIPRFFEYVIKKDAGGYVYAEPFLRNSSTHRTYMTVYYCASYLLTHFAIPFSILLIANTFMILAVCKAHRQRRLLSHQEKREHKMAFMMVLVVCEFLFCNTLPFALNIVELIDPSFFTDEDTQSLAWALNDVNNLLVIFNASTTAVIYAACSEKYRRLLLTLCTNICPFPCLSDPRGRAAYGAALCSQMARERRIEKNANDGTLIQKSPVITPWTKETILQSAMIICGREPLITGGDTTVDTSRYIQEDAEPDRQPLRDRRLSDDSFVSAREMCEISTVSLNRL